MLACDRACRQHAKAAVRIVWRLRDARAQGVYTLRQGVQGGAAAAGSTCVGVRPGIAVGNDVEVHEVYELALEHGLQLREREVGAVPVEEGAGGVRVLGADGAVCCQGGTLPGPPQRDTAVQAHHSRAQRLHVVLHPDRLSTDAHICCC